MSESCLSIQVRGADGLRQSTGRTSRSARFVVGGPVGPPSECFLQPTLRASTAVPPGRTRQIGTVCRPGVRERSPSRHPAAPHRTGLSVRRPSGRVLRVRDGVKYDQALAFAAALPALRRRLARDLSAAGLSKRRVVAAVVQLLEKTFIRVGNDEYARDNHSFGLTTMRNGHVRISRSTLRFRFRGKSGKTHDISFDDRRLARVVRRCQELPGHELFEYLDEDGNVHDIGSRTSINISVRQAVRISRRRTSGRGLGPFSSPARFWSCRRFSLTLRRSAISSRPSKPSRACWETPLRSAASATYTLPSSKRIWTERSLAPWVREHSSLTRCLLATSIGWTRWYWHCSGGACIEMNAGLLEPDRHKPRAQLTFLTTGLSMIP